MIDVVHVHLDLQDIEDAIPVLRELACAHEMYMKDRMRQASVSDEMKEFDRQIGKAYWAGLAACEAVCEALSEGASEAE